MIVHEFDISPWAIIAFILMFNIMIGTYLIIIGLRLRKYVTKELGKPKSRWFDCVALFMFIYCVWKEVDFWWIKGHYDGTGIEVIYIVTSIYWSVGVSIFIMFISGFIVIKYGKWKEGRKAEHQHD